MNFIDLYSLKLHRAIADRMIDDSDRIIDIAKRNLDRWLKRDGFTGPERRPLLEWKKILSTATPNDIRRIIMTDDDEGQRLRSSSPFTGILTKAEREKYWSECAEVEPV